MTRFDIPGLSRPSTTTTRVGVPHVLDRLLPRTATQTSLFGRRLRRPCLQFERSISSTCARPVISNAGGPFEPLRPPSPSSLGAPRVARTYPRGLKRVRILVILSAFLGVVYIGDRTLYASGMTRSIRTFGTGLLVALDYKINFRSNPIPGFGEGGIPELHRRSAERLFDLLRQNGGLYLKMGQAIAMQSAILPPEFQHMFARMFDDAPQDSWADVEKVIRADFGGKSVEEVFGVSFAGAEGKGVMERTARASASVAQVHWARLPDGREVAIKIQKPEIAKQISWDLWAFKVVTGVYSWWFDIPLSSLVPFVSERLRLETDFEMEANNSERMSQLVNDEPSLRGRVYVPPVYRDLSSRRVLTTEWIEGVRLWDKDALTRPWLGGHGRGSLGVQQLLPAPDMDAIRRELGQDPDSDKLKPERNEWRGPRGKGGLGVSTQDVMTTMVDLFSAQIFKWGVIHCDPHPGNIFIRRLPSGKAELVLIDHGLYVYTQDKFRREYCRFWKAMMTFDDRAIADITEQWGVKGPEMFASATLMRPYDGDKGSFRKKLHAEFEGMTASERSYAMQMKMKQGIRDMLADETKLPKELLFIGRNMRIVQGNNQYLGSPVNRIKLMGIWASRSLYEDKALPLRQRLSHAYQHFAFKALLTLTDVAFYFFKIRQWLGLGGNMEDEIESRMKDMAKEYGVELQHNVFDG